MIVNSYLCFSYKKLGLPKYFLPHLTIFCYVLLQYVLVGKTVFEIILLRYEI